VRTNQLVRLAVALVNLTAALHKIKHSENSSSKKSPNTLTQQHIWQPKGLIKTKQGDVCF